MRSILHSEADYRKDVRRESSSRTTHSNLRDLRWSPGQIVVHLAMPSYDLNTGGLLGTGAVSSPASFS